MPHAEGFTGSRRHEPPAADGKMNAVLPGRRFSFRTRMPSNKRRRAKERQIDITVKAALIFRFCASVTCTPKAGKIRSCVATATP